MLFRPTPPGPPAAPAASPLRTSPVLRALLAICLFTYVAQNMINVSIAPLARALGLREWIVGLAVSAAALCVSVLSQFWGRRSIAWGRRRVIICSLGLALVAGTLFTTTVVLRAAGVVGVVLASTGIILARGPFFGSAIAAIPPTGQALVAEVTPDEVSRLRGMAAFSGSIQLSILIGSLLSSVLGSWSIYAPVYATPVFVLVALLIAIQWVPRDRRHHEDLGEVSAATPAQPGPQRAGSGLPPRVSWSDQRIVPWIASAFGMFFTTGVIQIITGFIVQDRLGLDPSRAVTPTGLMLLANAAGAIVSQLGIVPHLGWRPHQLVRTGVTMALVAVVVLAWAPTLTVLVPATLMAGCGAGMVGPGFTAGGSLAVSPQEQGGVAGILNATGAVTWIFAPVTATALYGWHPMAPFALSLVALGISTTMAWTRLRAVGHSTQP